MTKPRSSDIVQSLAGHDKGELFFVLRTEDEYALLVDGKHRKLSKPKRKKQKHLAFEAQGDPPVADRIKSGDLVSDKEIRKALAVFKLRRDQARGGN
jgi:hypothetical protein